MTGEDAAARMMYMLEHEPEKIKKITRALFWEGHELLKRYGYE